MAKKPMGTPISEDTLKKWRRIEQEMEREQVEQEGRPYKEKRARPGEGQGRGAYRRHDGKRDG